MYEKYLIICLRHGYWERNDNLVFWGKNRSGYYSDLSKVGLYTKKEAVNLCDAGDCYISIDKIGLTKDMFESINPAIEIKVKKTVVICNYVNTFARIMKNKDLLRYGA